MNGTRFRCVAAGMNRRPFLSILRALGVMMLLVAWFAVSNHCALARVSGVSMQTDASVQRNCCSSEGGDSEQPADGSEGMCCKSIRALPTEGAAKVVEANEAPLVTGWIWAGLTTSPEGVSSLESTVAGKMRAEVPSFAEVVLQRSLLSHAPPLRV